MKVEEFFFDFPEVKYFLTSGSRLPKFFFDFRKSTSGDTF